MQKEWHDCVGLHYNYSSWVLTTVCQYAISSYRCLSYFGFNLFCLASHCYWQTSLQCPLINPRLQLLHHHSHVQYGIREYWCIQNWCIQRCGQHSRDNKMLTKKEEGRTNARVMLGTVMNPLTEEKLAGAPRAAVYVTCIAMKNILL